LFNPLKPNSRVSKSLSVEFPKDSYLIKSFEVCFDETKLEKKRSPGFVFLKIKQRSKFEGFTKYHPESNKCVFFFRIGLIGL